jgi:hypothetical protein
MEVRLSNETCALDVKCACGGPQELTHVKEKLHYQEKVTQELHEKFTRFN